jgi:hypothetical protein
MSIQKVNHNVWKAIDALSVAAGSSASLAAGTNVSEWWDVNGWTDKVITVEPTAANSGSVDVNVDIYVSPKGYYELRNETTVNTEDYQVIQIVDNLTTGTLKRYDSSDVDDLQRPIRSMCVALDNGDASDACTVNVWVEGWS